MKTLSAENEGVFFMEKVREFRKIPSLGYEYEVSADGEVIRRVDCKRELTQSPFGKSKIYLGFCASVNGVRHTGYVAQAVAEAWLGAKADENLQVDHIDRNPRNNHYTNLRYVTRSEQQKNRDYSKIAEFGRKSLSKINERRKKPVALLKNGERQNFDSWLAAAKYLSGLTGKNCNTLVSKFYNRKPNVAGYIVIYEDK